MSAGAWFEAFGWLGWLGWFGLLDWLGCWSDVEGMDVYMYMCVCM